MTYPSDYVMYRGFRGAQIRDAKVRLAFRLGLRRDIVVHTNKEVTNEINSDRNTDLRLVDNIRPGRTYTGWSRG